MKAELTNPFEVLSRDLQTLNKNVSLLLRRTDPATPPPTPPEEKFLDQKQVAELLQISGVSVWQWEKKGLLQSYRIGNLKRFKLSEILEAPKRIVRTKKGGATL
jgi:predicted DNA-binding transcriptional regulator AlpA